MKKIINKPVPVLMFHSVGVPDARWNWNYLTCPYEVFEDQLRTLKQKGYKSINLHQLYDYIFESKPIPEKSIVFTFDDGYLDNWVFAYPLMKKYGFQGTIYVNPEFVDNSTVKRKRIDEVTDTKSLQTIGFLSWEEMLQMESENVMLIESHALTHTWYPKSNKIIDFRHPGDNYIWMTWNSNSQLKYDLQIDNESLVELGEPVYEYVKSLSGKQFFPDENLKLHMCNYIQANGGKSFFETINWKAVLNNEVDKYKSEHLLNERYETDFEYHKRISSELNSTKTIIESKLKKEVDFHCWPGGSATIEGMEIANNLGFKLSNVADDILEIRYKIKNNNLFKINRINRFVPIVYYANNINLKKNIQYSSGRVLLLQIYAFTKSRIKSIFYKIVLEVIKKYSELKNK